MSGRKQYILFTMQGCEKCADLKQDISNLNPSLGIATIDLSALPPGSKWLKVFDIVSPKSTVPAFAAILYTP